MLSLGLAGCAQISEGVQKQFADSTDSEGGGNESSGGGGGGSSGGDGSNEGQADSGGDSTSGAAIEYGETHQGSVEEGDGTAPEYGGLAAPVTFEGESGDVVQITMVSEAFDTHLVLEAPDGSVVAENDDRSGDRNSEIETTLSRSGTYTVWCSSWSETSTGSYQLTVETVDRAGGSENLRSIAYGETKSGFVDQSDGTDPEFGGVAEPVTFEGENGDSVRITMESGAFDTYLVLEAPDGSVVAQNDDRERDFNSEIETTLSQSGTYTVWCTSFSESATGPYTLTLERA